MEKNATRQWDTLSAVLLALIVLFSAWRLQTTDWTEMLGRVRNIALLGMLVGLALGLSRFKRRGVVWLSLGYMVVFFIWQWLGIIQFKDDQTYLGDQLLILFGRLFTNFNEFFAGRAVEDQFLILILLCIPYWFASLYSGYQLTRYSNYLGSVLPHGILMFLVQILHYTTRDYTWMFGVYLFIALLLLSRQKFLADQKKWAREHVQVSSTSGLDMSSTAMLVAGVMIVAAWGVPYVLPSTAQGREFWQNNVHEWFSGERFDKMFASINKEKQPKPRTFQTEMALGVRTPQSDLVVFQVYVPNNAEEYPRFYWRGQVFDEYVNGRWRITGQSEARRESTGGDFEIPDIDNRKRLGFTFDWFVDGQTLLYTPSQPVWVNHDAILLYSGIPAESENTTIDSEEDPLLDVMALRASPILNSGDVYRAFAFAANPIVSELQAAGESYPSWVTEKYLQLPQGFSPRIRALAEEITAPYETPYDKSVAITEYLRQEIAYAGTISFPDESVDQLEYFLFDGKRGFCNYYASAQVLMLRSVGIPARLAVGYAQGEPNVQNSIYVVRERDLHAWPEVYFPGYGWVEFEPTGNQNPLERPQERDEVIRPIATPGNNPIRPLPLGEDDLPLEELDPQGNASAAALVRVMLTALTWLGGAFVILAVIVLKKRLAPDVSTASMLKRAIERSGLKPPRWVFHWLFIASLPPIERYFQSINTSLKWMKKTQPIHATAVERAQALKKALPTAADSIDRLLQEHLAQAFSPHGGAEAPARRAAWDIIFKALQEKLKF